MDEITTVPTKGPMLTHGPLARQPPPKPPPLRVNLTSTPLTAVVRFRPPIEGHLLEHGAEHVLDGAVWNDKSPVAASGLGVQLTELLIDRARCVDHALITPRLSRT